MPEHYVPTSISKIYFDLKTVNTKDIFLTEILIDNLIEILTSSASDHGWHIIHCLFRS